MSSSKSALAAGAWEADESQPLLEPAKTSSPPAGGEDVFAGSSSGWDSSASQAPAASADLDDDIPF